MVYLAGLIALFTILGLAWLSHQCLNGRPLFWIKYRQSFAVFIILICTVLFVVIAYLVQLNAESNWLDQLIPTYAQRVYSTIITQFFSGITHLGDTRTFIVLWGVITLTLIVFKKFILAFTALLAIGGNSLLNPFLKALFVRVRPLHDIAYSTHGWSFPSGHTSGAIIVYGILAYILIKLTAKKWHWPIILAASAVAFTVGFSRIYLHVHYLSDVLAGGLSGIAWLTFCITSSEIISSSNLVKKTQR